ncbi:albusnodin/ikarugamycin family macrolactam cyclase [Nocardiopsis sp. NPDC006832]|uniref:albusnodin/ikarugamycin family macrolactam cyclase n=1 Tax=Nocardiopsis sp. NPDC006832 TaxID=3157188 RepID=UPI0033C7A73A
MEWFGGVSRATGTPSVRPISPSWVHELPCGELWTVGPGAGYAVTVAKVGLLSGAVLGSHAVSTDQLSMWLSGDRRSGPPPWPGTYTVMVIDPEGMTVFADPAHALPLHFSEVEGSVVWASSSRALSGLTGTGVDPAWVSGLLVNPMGAYGRERSAFLGVRTVPPGHYLEVRKGMRVELGRWWVSPPSTPLAQASQVFRTALEEAVAVRSAQAEHLSCDLSGGLDSTTLCLLAERRTTEPRSLTAWTVHPASRDHGGDLDYAREAARDRSGMKHTLVPLTEAELPYSGLGRVPPTDEPAPSTITGARHMFAYKRIHAAGSTLHLTGDGGDALLMQSPELTLRLAGRGRLFRALRDLHGWAKLDRKSTLRLLPRLFQAGSAPCSERLTPKARDMALAIPSPRVLDMLGRDAELFALQGIGRTAHSDTQFAAFHGVRLEAPFLDRSVVEAALSFRVGDRGSPWSYKPQLTRAMRDLLPMTVAQRRTKGGTDADHHLGSRAHLPQVRDLLVEGWLAGHGLIDLAVLDRELCAAASGKDTPWGLLEPVVSAEVWARAVEANPSPAWSRIPAEQEAVG